jgi:hypothetical protein
LIDLSNAGMLRELGILLVLSLLSACALLHFQ